MENDISFTPSNNELIPTQEAINIFTHSLGIEFGEDGYDITINKIKVILDYCKKYNQELNQIAAILHQIDDNIETIRQRYIDDHIGFTRDGMPPSVNYIIFKEIQNYNLSITQTLKTGYTLVNTIRQFFTNEKIIYEVGILKKKGREVQDFTVNEEDILKMSGLSYNSQATKIEDILKLNITKYGKVMSEKQKAESILDNDISNAKTIFGKVVKTLSNGKYLPQLNNKKVNRGFIYETYKAVLAKRSYSNKNSQDLTPREIIKTYQKVSKTNFRGASFYSGGDFMNKQYKLLSTKPQIVSYNSLCLFMAKFISETEKYLATNNVQQYIDYLTNNLTQQQNGRQLLDRIARASANEARDFINTSIKNLS